MIPFGEATNNPATNASANSMPLKASELGFVTVKLSEVVPFTEIVAGAKALLITGGTNGVTFRLAVAVLPTAPWSMLAVALLVTVPTIVAITLIETVHELFAASVAPVRLTVASPADAVMLPPPHDGRLHKARELSEEAIDAALRGEAKEAAALWQMNAAIREAEVGNIEVARKGVAAALALSEGRDLKIGSALVLAKIGDPRARSMAEELEKEYPTNTIVKVYWLPTINALIEMHSGNASKAVAELQAAAPYELGLTGTFFINYIYPAYVRGEAFLMEHNGPAAAVEFQKMLDHPGIVTNFVTGSLAHLQIARAYARMGNQAAAKTEYENFLQLWKDADADTPVLKAAKKEYAKLR